MAKTWQIQALAVLALGIYAPAVSGQALRGVTATEPTQLVEASVICGAMVPPPAVLPPAASGPIVYLIAPCFIGAPSQTDPQVYLRDIKLKPSRPSLREWVPYDATAERLIFEDFHRIWKGHTLANLSIDIRDYSFANGVVGKIVTYNIAEGR